MRGQEATDCGNQAIAPSSGRASSGLCFRHGRKTQQIKGQSDPIRFFPDVFGTLRTDVSPARIRNAKLSIDCASGDVRDHAATRRRAPIHLGVYHQGGAAMMVAPEFCPCAAGPETSAAAGHFAGNRSTCERRRR
jgi:hypothetical protein